MPCARGGARKKAEYLYFVLLGGRLCRRIKSRTKPSRYVREPGGADNGQPGVFLPGTFGSTWLTGAARLAVFASLNIM
jgi:hypothetical protein